MKSSVIIAAVGVLLACTAGQAVGATRQAHALKTVTVVMHDPGCHWFSTAGKFTTKLTVHGPVALANLDEAALKVAGPKGVQFDRVGQKLVLSPGVYRVTMVGQASDDNHLKLVVT
jgi:hypothetical protein